MVGNTVVSDPADRKKKLLDEGLLILLAGHTRHS
jgi:hypothetical protein